MGKQTTTITLDASSLDEPLAYLYNIDVELLARLTSQAERLKAVEAVVSETPLDDAQFVELAFENCVTIGDYNKAAAELVASLDQFHAEQVKSVYKETYGSDSVDDLLAARETIVKSIEATSTILVQLGVIDAAPVIPNAPGKRSGGGATRGVKVSNAQYYSVYGGKRRDQSSQQNSLSSIAYYHGKHLLGIEDRPSTAQLRQAIVNAGGTPDAATSWAVELPGGVVGMDVKE